MESMANGCLTQNIFWWANSYSMHDVVLLSSQHKLTLIWIDLHWNSTHSGARVANFVKSIGWKVGFVGHPDNDCAWVLYKITIRTHEYYTLVPRLFVGKMFWVWGYYLECDEYILDNACSSGMQKLHAWRYIIATSGDRDLILESHLDYLHSICVL